MEAYNHVLKFQTCMKSGFLVMMIQTLKTTLNIQQKLRGKNEGIFSKFGSSKLKNRSSYKSEILVCDYMLPP